jgi:hypothetical protein
LLGLLEKKLGDTEMMWLVEKVVRSFSGPGTPGVGMPIGNLTSQIFANIYLSELDYFAKHTLREHYYFRYADDFLFLHPDREHLVDVCAKITDFVQEKIRLTVHPKKIVYRKYSQGIDWLGYVLRPHYRVLRTNTKQRMFTKVHRKVEEFNAGLCDEYSLDQTVQSYVGVLSHCEGHGLAEKLRSDVWLEKTRRE